MLKKIINTIHLYLGLATGVIVFTLGVTGYIRAFIEGLKPLVYQERFFVDESGDKPLSINK